MTKHRRPNQLTTIPDCFVKQFDITKVAKAQPDRLLSEQEAPYYRGVQIWDCIEIFRGRCDGCLKVYNTTGTLTYIDPLDDPDKENIYINWEQNWIFNNFMEHCYNPDVWEVFYYDVENQMFFFRHKRHGYVITYCPAEPKVKFRLVTIASTSVLEKIRQNFVENKIDGTSFGRQYTSAFEPLVYSIAVGLIDVPLQKVPAHR